MRYLIVSDLHGSSSGARRIQEIVARVKPDTLLMLGDILRGGRDEDSYYAASVLQSLPCGILAVKGNCDYSIDGETIGVELPLVRQISFANNRHTAYLSHHPLGFPLPPGDISMHGHTHVKRLEIIKGAIYFNPGSIAYPRDDGVGYGIFDEHKLQLFDALKESLIQEVSLD
ncbi:MAG: metallophosphoesterase family protein [Bacilli bacterium]|nr:metallophosphoesterase family protein [Bacilli bacterium]